MASQLSRDSSWMPQFSFDSYKPTYPEAAQPRWCNANGSTGILSSSLSSSSWTPHGFNSSCCSALLSLSLFNSPPHPASPLPRLPLPSSGFVCSPSAPRCFPARPRVPLSRGAVKLLFRSDSGTLDTGCLPTPPRHHSHHKDQYDTCDTLLTYWHTHRTRQSSSNTHTHTHTHTHTPCLIPAPSLFLPHPTITQQTLLPVRGGTMVG